MCSVWYCSLSPWERGCSLCANLSQGGSSPTGRESEHRKGVGQRPTA